MRHEAQLDLGVVGHQEAPAGPGDEALADGLTPRRTDGDVLEIRIRGAEPAGGGAGLVEAGVDAAGAPVDGGRQRVHVGALELLQLAVVEDEPRQLVAHGGELLEHVGVGARPGLGALENRELLLLEQDRRKLPGRV